VVSAKERVSALIDGELGGAEWDELVERMKSDPELRRTWDDYQLIGDALRGEAFRSDLDAHFGAGVSARLAAEPTALAPPRQRDLPHHAGWYALAAAASVSAVALVVWTALPVMQPQPQVASDAPGGTGIVPISASTPPPAENRVDVENYLLAHQPFSHAASAAVRADLATAGWVIRSLPPGFRVVAQMTRTLGGRPGVGHIVLSDGQAAVSVFIEPTKQPAPQAGLVRQGPTNVYARALGAYWITAVGEVPAESVKYVADAVEYRK
jgi:hypothetical protein